MKTIRWNLHFPPGALSKKLGLLICLLALVCLPLGTSNKRCKEYLMKSYHLDGLHSAEEIPNPMCPTLEHSCCSKVDPRPADP